MMMKKKKSLDEEELELGQEMSCMNVIYNRYVKSPWPDANEEQEHQPNESVGEQVVLTSRKRTNLCIWCIALLCSLIAIAIILSGLVVLTGYLLFHPKLPKLDVTKAALTIHLDLTTFLYNSQMDVLLIVTNPNDRVDLFYEYNNFKLFFRNDMVARQLLPPFSQMRGNGNWTLKNIVLASNDAEITPLSAQIMVAQARNNSIQYQLYGNLRVVARFGSIARVPYWLNLDCNLEFSTPPNGVLRSHKCTANR